MQITGRLDKLSIEEKTKLKTKGTPAPAPTVVDVLAIHVDGIDKADKQKTITLDKHAYKAIKALFHFATSDTGEFPKAVKWDEFKRAMVRIGFVAEKLQGSAWQFTL